MLIRSIELLRTSVSIKVVCVTCVRRSLLAVSNADLTRIVFRTHAKNGGIWRMTIRTLVENLPTIFAQSEIIKLNISYKHVFLINKYNLRIYLTDWDDAIELR